MESCNDFDTKTLPTQDLKIWVSEDNKCLYTFFEKPTATNQVIHKESAMPENMRVSTLNQEVTRRMLNTSELLDDGVRCRVLDDFCMKMGNSGYGVGFMRKVVIGGITGYERKLVRSRDKSKPDWRPLHESAARSAGRRTKKKILDKSTWFKPKERSQESNQDIVDLNKEEQELLAEVQEEDVGVTAQAKGTGGPARGQASPMKTTTPRMSDIDICKEEDKKRKRDKLDRKSSHQNPKL